MVARLDAVERAPRALMESSDKIPLADGSVHLVVTSPPYPMIEMWDDAFARWTGVAPDDARFFAASHEALSRVWRECARVLAPGGIAAVNIGDACRGGPDGFRLWANHVEVSRACEDAGLVPLVPILWKKPTNRPNAFLGSGFLPPNAYVTLDCEHILLFRKGAPRRFPPKDLLRYASEISKAERDAWFTQVWDMRGARQDRSDLARRTAAFPDAVPDRLVRMFSALGDVVLDPFAGTGTTMRVAAAAGRRAVGMEVEQALAPLLAAIHAPSAPEVVDALIARYSASGRTE